MRRSAGECQNLVCKAARGAGLSWGVAEDSGRAAAWLASRGLPFFSDVLTSRSRMSPLSRKTRPHRWVVTKSERPLCPLSAGIYLSDCLAGGFAPPQRLPKTARPLMLAPFVACAAKAPLCLSWRNASFIVSGGDIWLLDKQNLNALTAAVSISQASLPRSSPLGRSSDSGMTDKAWRQLESLADATLVPASSRSRATGAGPAGE